MVIYLFFGTFLLLTKYIYYMKTRCLFLFITLFCLTSISSSAQDDITAIKGVIEKETVSFQNVERKNWEDTWLKTPYAYWSYSDSTGTTFSQGWDAISKSFDTYFKTQVAGRKIDVAHKDSPLTIERTWGEIRIYKNGAFVQYGQKVKDHLIDRDETSQIRFLEKSDGKWKVVYVGIIAKYPK